MVLENYPLLLSLNKETQTLGTLYDHERERPRINLTLWETEKRDGNFFFFFFVIWLSGISSLFISGLFS